MKLWGRRLFYLFLIFTLKFVEIRKMTTKFVDIFESKTFLVFWSSPFSLDPHSRIRINKFFVPPPKFISAPLQLRYPGAGPASVAYKLMFVILLYLPSCFGQETAKEPFGHRVKLPRLVYHTLWSLHAVALYR